MWIEHRGSHQDSLQGYQRLTPTTLGHKFLSAATSKLTVQAWASYGSIDHLFKGAEIESFSFIYDYVRKYGEMPSQEAFQDATGHKLPNVPDAPGYYLDQLKDRHTAQAMKEAVEYASAKIQPGNVGARDALEALSSRIFALNAENNPNTIVDFRNAKQHVIDEYLLKWNLGDQYGIQLGWPTIDNLIGGVMQGDLVSFVGRPAMGKTWKIMWSAMHAWDVQGKLPMIVSLEMPPIQLEQRLAAIYTHIPISHIKQQEGKHLSSASMDYLTAKLDEASEREVPFPIVDGNLGATTVEELYMLCRQIKPDVVYIDGAYLMGHSDGRLNRYQRVAENCDLLKSLIAGELGIPVIASWQFNKDAAKKSSKGEAAGLEDIGYSDAIGQHSSVVLGLFEEESVETMYRRKIDILKDRHSGRGQFYMNWDFKNMDFSESDEDPSNFKYK